MSELVSKIGVKREPGFLYFLRGSDVYKTPMKRAGQPSTAGQEKLVVAGNFTREEGYLYFLDKNGNIARAKRAVGGQKRKKPKTEKKAPAKKVAAKKTAAPAKKAAPAAKKPVAKAPAKKAAAPAKKAPPAKKPVAKKK
jgi:hypothetical protein